MPEKTPPGAGPVPLTPPIHPPLLLLRYHHHTTTTSLYYYYIIILLLLLLLLLLPGVPGAYSEWVLAAKPWGA